MRNHAHHDADPVRVGDVLNRTYKLLQLIERGATTAVYEAEDTLLSRRVAIKLHEDPHDGVERLVDEARALSAVRHPGLPTVYGVGQHRGRSYLVVERIYGVSLAQHLDQVRGRKLTLDEGLAILAPIAETLAAIHAAGHAHRALTTANVILSPGRSVLLELGTTPRELRPGAGQLADTHAFGALAFEVFTGGPPGQADTLPYLVVERPDLPRALAELVDACLAPDPPVRARDLQAITWELRNVRRRGGRSEPGTPWVLIVDDDEVSRTNLASVLGAQGFRTLLAADGRQAIELIRRTGWRPAVIVLDLMMPVMDGYQFLAIQAEDDLLCDIPVVLLTAHRAEDARRFAAVRGVMPKPFAMSTLLVLLREVCRQACFAVVRDQSQTG